MTELERTLKNTLLTLEQELNATQKMHGTSLVNHQRSLESHAQTIRQLVLPGFPWVTPVRNWPGRGLDRHRRSRWLS